MRRCIAILLATLAFVVQPAQAQQPDRHGEITLKTPVYQGVKANAPIPPALHIRNEGGRDGAGLCVIASVLCDGRYQKIPGLERGKESRLWKVAKARKGGYYPGKLKTLLNEVLPDERWVSLELTSSKADAVLKKYSAAGYPIGATMSTGALYGYASIHHMISLVHYDANLACVVDNNDPGKYHWMPAKEFLRRFQDGAQGWLFVWLRLPSSKVGTTTHLTLLMFLASGALILGRPRQAGLELA